MSSSLLRPSVLAFSALALVGGLLVGCDKGSGSGAGAVTSGNMITHVPAGSATVGGASLDKLRQSDLFKKYQDKFLADLPPEIKEAKDLCGFDVINDIGSIVMGAGADPNDQDKMVIAMSGNFDEDKAKKCFMEMDKKHSKGDGEPSVAKEGKLTVYTTGEGEKGFAFWPDSKTVVVSPGGMEDAGKLNALIGGKSVKDNKDLADLMSKVDTGAAIWAAGAISKDMAGGMGPMAGNAPSHFYMSMNVTSGVSGKIGLRFESEEKAKGTMTMAQGLLAMAKGSPEAAQFADIIDAVKFEHSGTEITVSVELSAEQIDKLAKQAM